MVVLEAGIIKSSLAIIRSEYYPSEVKVDPLVKTSLLDALKVYADKAFNDQIQEVRFKKFLIITKDLS